MNRVAILKNTIQEYAWGSHTAIPELLGTECPSDMPQAELWMGAHPKAPSMVKWNDSWTSLAELIEKNPDDILGKKVVTGFGSRLPFLFKVLAAAEPLSLQAHPSLVQAKEGFKRENELNIPLDAANRSYKDDNHKPECICALTSFWALNGFRKISEILSYMEAISSSGLTSEIHELRLQPDSQGLRTFFYTLVNLDDDRKKQVIDDAISYAEKQSEANPIYQWMIKLHDAYPSDIGVLSPVLLNLICLEPGQAMFLQAGELHAYLDGVGIELMANSDNVLRGGLTPKFIDVSELMNVLNFKEREIKLLAPIQKQDCEYVYESPVEEFVLSSITLKRDVTYYSETDRNVEILLCINGNANLRSDESGGLVISKGTSVLIPASVSRYNITGDAVFYKASVPI